MLTRETRTRDIVIKTVKRHICTSRKFMAAFEDFFLLLLQTRKKTKKAHMKSTVSRLK